MQDTVIIELARRAPAHRQLSRDDLWAISRHGLQIVWSVVFLFFTPPIYDSLVERNLTVMFVGFIIIGALAASAGRGTFQHLTIELPGIIFILGGFITYAALQVVAIVNNPDETTGTRFAFAVLILLVIHPSLDRFSFLGNRFAVAVGWKKDGIALRKRKVKAQ